MRTELEEVWLEEDAVPAEATRGRVAVERVSVPLEEAGAGKERATQPGARTRKVGRQFRMASCATLTLQDRKGEARPTLR